MSQRNCESSGFVAAQAPTGDYGIDVHIDTGVLGLSSGGLLSAVQELLVTPLWMALVWAVHALVVMLEWCFTIDLLDSASVGAGVGTALRQIQSTFTAPWLATVLAISSVLTAYNGLIRRRVAEALGQSLLTMAMMAAGIWITLDPLGTVGALGRWANQASLGTLAVTASGTPARAGKALADSMGSIFTAAIEVPWCYLEFGDVGWCRNPTRLDPRLRAAALSIAAGELTLARCGQNSRLLHLCPGSGSAEAGALERSARLLRTARSNGEIFLALPANGSGRNSIGDPKSLLSAICQSDDATSCRGPASAEAEFRTDRGTWPRVGGLLLIVTGVLGMLLMFGFVGMRLLAAALFSLLYLMLAPAAVLAPALGERGRAVFRNWGTQLFGALVSKLVFSFLLGAILAVLAVLASLEALGWWTQWLLMSAFWWGAFARRRQALHIAGGAWGRDARRDHRMLTTRASDALDGPRRLIGSVREAKERRASRSLEVRRRGEPSVRLPPLARRGQHAGGAASRARPTGRVDEQARRALAADQRDAQALLETARDVEQRMSAKRAQLARIAEQRGRALASGDVRRATQLASRDERTKGELEHEQETLSAARRVVAATRRSPHELIGERESFLDAQAALPSSVEVRGQRKHGSRDYKALAGLAGYGPREYERLRAPGKRVARLEIDRELASRAQRSGLERRESPTATGRTASEYRAGRIARRAGAAAGERSTGADSRAGEWPRSGSRDHPVMTRRSARPLTPARHEPVSASESSVMRDAREVAARRKRQLGPDRP